MPSPYYDPTDEEDQSQYHEGDAEIGTAVAPAPVARAVPDRPSLADMLRGLSRVQATPAPGVVPAPARGVAAPVAASGGQVQDSRPPLADMLRGLAHGRPTVARQGGILGAPAHPAPIAFAPGAVQQALGVTPPPLIQQPQAAPEPDTQVVGAPVGGVVPSSAQPYDPSASTRGQAADIGIGLTTGPSAAMKNTIGGGLQLVGSQVGGDTGEFISGLGRKAEAYYGNTPQPETTAGQFAQNVTGLPVYAAPAVAGGGVAGILGAGAGATALASGTAGAAGGYLGEGGGGLIEARKRLSDRGIEGPEAERMAQRTATAAGLTGTLEALPVFRIAGGLFKKPLAMAAQKTLARLAGTRAGHALLSAAEEGAQEAITELTTAVMQDVNELDPAAYDGLTQRLLASGGTGAILGGGAAAVTQGAAHNDGDSRGPSNAEGVAPDAVPPPNLGSGLAEKGQRSEVEPPTGELVQQRPVVGGQVDNLRTRGTQEAVEPLGGATGDVVAGRDHVGVDGVQALDNTGRSVSSSDASSTGNIPAQTPEDKTGKLPTIAPADRAVLVREWEKASADLAEGTVLGPERDKLQKRVDRIEAVLAPRQTPEEASRAVEAQAAEPVAPEPSTGLVRGATEQARLQAEQRLPGRSHASERGPLRMSDYAKPADEVGPEGNAPSPEVANAGRTEAVGSKLSPTGETPHPLGGLDPAALRASFDRQGPGHVKAGRELDAMVADNTLRDVDRDVILEALHDTATEHLARANFKSADLKRVGQMSIREGKNKAGQPATSYSVQVKKGLASLADAEGNAVTGFHNAPDVQAAVVALHEFAHFGHRAILTPEERAQVEASYVKARGKRKGHFQEGLSGAGGEARSNAEHFAQGMDEWFAQGFAEWVINGQVSKGRMSALLKKIGDVFRKAVERLRGRKRVEALEPLWEILVKGRKRPNATPTVENGARTQSNEFQKRPETKPGNEGENRSGQAPMERVAGLQAANASRPEVATGGGAEASRRTSGSAGQEMAGEAAQTEVRPGVVLDGENGRGATAGTSARNGEGDRTTAKAIGDRASQEPRQPRQSAGELGDNEPRGSHAPSLQTSSGEVVEALRVLREMPGSDEAVRGARTLRRLLPTMEEGAQAQVVRELKGIEDAREVPNQVSAPEIPQSVRPEAQRPVQPGDGGAREQGVEAQGAERTGERGQTPEAQPEGKVLNDGRAAKFRKAAEALTGQAEKRRDSSYYREARTARQARIGESIGNEAERMDRLGKVLGKLADAAEAGTLPPSLHGLKTASQVSELFTRARIAEQNKQRARPGMTPAQEIRMPKPLVSASDVRAALDRVKGIKGAPELRDRLGLYTRPPDEGWSHFVQSEESRDALRKLEKMVKASGERPIDLTSHFKDYETLAAAGITTDGKLSRAASDLLALEGGRAAPADNGVTALERDLIGKTVGRDFFPTPKAVAADLVERADIREGQRVLEPSAGNGHIADAIKEAGVKPDVVEVSGDLREILKAKGHEIVGGDFEHYNPGEVYDRVVMNPPFSSGLDMTHVRHAFDLLKPGGKLVAIMSEGSFFRGDKKATAFRDWLDDNGATSEKLPEGTFNTPQRGLPTTGTATRIVEVTKPERIERDANTHNPLLGNDPTTGRPITASQLRLVNREGAAPDAIPTKSSPGPHPDENTSQPQDPLGFYSRVDRFLAEKMKGPMQGPQLLRAMENAGLSPDEIKWTGLDEFLGNKAKVSPEEMKAYLAENRVVLREKSLGGEGASKIAELTRQIDQLRRYNPVPEAEAARLGTANELRRLMDERERLLNENAPESSAQYEQFTLPGGTNYREVLLTLPSKNPPLEEWGQKKERAGPGDFKSSHFSEPNIIAHMRVKDRTTPDGKRVLFAEEVQSDWHQAGREKGYARDTKGWTAHRLNGPDSGFGHWQIKDAEGKEVTKIVGGESEEGAIRKAAEGIPSAPFSKTWHEMALRRLVRMAAEGGYDAVGWTTGKQQAQRYDIGEHISAVRWRPTNDEGRPGTTIIRLERKSEGSTIELRVNKDGTVEQADLSYQELIGKPLSDVIGTENARAILSKPDGTLRPEDLALGGEGMREFYDRILPRYASKFAKKWGAKATEGTIQTRPGARWDIQRIDNGRGGYEYEVYPSDAAHADDDTRTFQTRKEAEKFADAQGDSEAAHLLPITDAMRDSVLGEGVHLFGPSPDDPSEPVFPHDFNRTPPAKPPQGPVVPKYPKIAANAEVLAAEAFARTQADVTGGNWVTNKYQQLLGRADDTIRAFATQIGKRADDMALSVEEATKKADSMIAQAEALAKTDPTEAARMVAQAEKLREAAKGAESRAQMRKNDAATLRALAADLSHFARADQSIQNRDSEVMGDVLRGFTPKQIEDIGRVGSGYKPRGEWTEKMARAEKAMLYLADQGEAGMNTAAQLGLKRRGADGKLRALRGSGKWMPLGFNKEGIAFKKEFAKLGLTSPRLNAIADEMVAAGHYDDAGEAIKAIKDDLNKSSRGTNPYFERTRIPWPERLIDFNVRRVYGNVLRRNAKTVAAGKVFGGYNDANELPKVEDAMAALRFWGEQDPDLRKEAFRLEQYLTMELGKPPIETADRTIAKWAMWLQNILKLSGPFTAFRNTFQPLINNADMGVMPLLRGYLVDFPAFVAEATPTGRRTARTAALSGSTRGINRGLTNDAIESVRDPGLGTPIAQQISNVFGYLNHKGNESANARSDAISRRGAIKGLAELAALEGKNGPLRQFAATLGRGWSNAGAKAAVERKMLRLGFTPETLATKVASGERLTPDELDMAGWFGSQNSQFVINTASKPVYYETNPFARIFTQWARWGQQQSILVYQNYLKEAALGNVRPLATMIVAGLIAGELYAIINDYLRQKDRAASALLNSKDKGRAKEIARRLIDNGLDLGMLGAINDAHNGVLNYVGGPTVQSLLNIAKTGASVLRRPTLTQAELAGKELASNEASGLRQWRDLVRTMLMDNRRGIATRQIRAQAAAFAKRTKQKDANEIIADEAKNRLLGPNNYGEGAGTLTYRYAALAITAGDTRSAARYMHDLIAGAESNAELDKVLGGLQASEARSAPLGGMGEEARGAYLKSLTPERRKAVIAVDMEWRKAYNTALRAAAKAAREEKRARRTGQKVTP